MQNMHLFHTLTAVQSGTSVALQQCIDNRTANLRIGLRSITYTVGWYNVGPRESVSWRPSGSTDTAGTAEIEPGLYRFSHLQNFINSIGVNLILRHQHVTNQVSLQIPAGWEMQFTDGLLFLLGLDDGLHGEWLDSGIYIGDRPINLVGLKTLQVYLEQLRTTGNFVDGARSTLLATVGAGQWVGRNPLLSAFETVCFENPEFKHLTNGLISELTVTIRDDRGNLLDNHGQPISIVLEIC